MPGQQDAIAKREPLAVTVFNQLQRAISQLDDRVGAVENGFNPVLRPLQPTPPTPTTAQPGRAPTPAFIAALMDEVEKLNALNERLAIVLDRREV